MRRVQWESEQLRKHMTSTLARLAERQLEVTRLEKALSAALVRGDMDAREESAGREPRLDAAPVRHQAAELRLQAEQLARDFAAAAAAADGVSGEAGMAEVSRQEGWPPGPEEVEPAPAAGRDFREAPIVAAGPGVAPETAEVAQGPAEQNVMLDSLFHFLEQDRKPGR